jgi:ribosomal protein S24E
MKLIKEIDETMLDRKTLIYQADKSASGITRADLQQKIAVLQKVDPKLVVVREIISELKGSKITAQVYANQKAYDALVSESLAKKSEVAVEEPKSEAVKDEVAVEEPKSEEAKDEVAVEEPKVEAVKDEVAVEEPKVEGAKEDKKE